MYKKFVSVLGKYKSGYLGLILCTSLLSAFMAVLNPLLLKYIFDEGVIKKDFRTFLVVVLLFIVVATGWRYLSLKAALYSQRLRNSMLKDLTARLLEKYYSLPYAGILSKKGGYYASRIYDEPHAAVNATVDLGTDLTAAVVNSISAFAIITTISPRATLALLAIVPGLAVLAKRFSGRIKKHSGEEKEEEGLLRKVLSRATEAYRSVIVFGLTGAARKAVDIQLDKFTGSLYKRSRQSMLYGTSASILSSYSETLVIIVCGYEMLNGAMTFGGFMGFMNAFWIAMGGVRSFISKFPEIARTEALIDRMAEFDVVQGSGQAAEKGEEVMLDAVSFGYDAADIISGLNMQVGRGDKVLLTGGNGCGKSTLANMISGFLLPRSGRLRVFPPGLISSCVSPHLFIPGTLRDNIRYDSLRSGEREYADSLLKELDLDVHLDKDPDAMSAGQRKKAEVVMGLLKEADLYIFDEPLANVDVESKSKLMTRIFERSRKKTLIVIMHGDPEYKDRFDRIIPLVAPAAR